jgi:hypothetical protein
LIWIILSLGALAYSVWLMLKARQEYRRRQRRQQTQEMVDRFMARALWGDQDPGAYFKFTKDVDPILRWKIENRIAFQVLHPEPGSIIKAGVS